jgi:predicted patatin/cPLA2 family phospholipase
MEDERPAHPVARLIAERTASGSRPGERTDAHRLALVIEGGGMRGAISGGMAMALEELGHRDAFDDVWGASAGALNAAWFSGGATAAGLPAWTDPVLRTATVRRRNLLRGRPLVDGRYLTEVVYERLTPMPFEAIVVSPVRLHPGGTDAATGEATDLAPFVRDRRTLKLALRASTALPLLSGPPVALGGRRFFDAGLAAAVPFRLALEHGATHVLVLRSRRADEQEIVDGSRSTAIAERYLRRHSAGVATAFVGRAARLLQDDAELEELERQGDAGPAVLSVRPPAGTADIGRLERDHLRVVEGLEAGRATVHALLRSAADAFGGTGGTSEGVAGPA